MVLVDHQILAFVIVDGLEVVVTQVSTVSTIKSKLALDNFWNTAGISNKYM